MERRILHYLSYRRISLIGIILFLGVLVNSIQAVEQTAAPAVPSAPESIKNEDCLDCHDTFNLDKFHGSIHGNNQCTSCHTSIKELPHDEKLPKVDCATCHHIESQIYNASDHGMAKKGGIQAADCLGCHGNAHEMPDIHNSASPVNRLNIAKTCSACHEDKMKMQEFHLLVELPYKTYAETVHGKALLKGNISAATCTDCHGSHDLHAPQNPNSKINPANIPQTCGKCHENVLKTYQESIHGKAAKNGKREAPVCTDCHGEHNILSRKDPQSSVYATNISEKTCGHCHNAEKIISKYRLPSDRLKTYEESYHGLANQFGVTTVANCASCHGAHDVLPSGDPRSSVNKNNLVKTCSKCHPNAGEQLAKGTVHVAPSPLKDQAVYFVTMTYVLLIVVVIGGMLLHNALDFRKKIKEHYEKKKNLSTKIRFTLVERIQHWCLFMSFTVLAYSGFALKYADAWWAVPFRLLSADLDVRALTHRIAACVFVIISIWHFVYAVFTKRGRQQLSLIWVKKTDFTDFVEMMLFNLGIRKKRPPHRAFTYIEKAEYWALIWGSLIMILTGAILTFENWSMKFFPKWALDVATTIHLYEAMLATLAIIVWHFYFVIFDPAHYPMNWSMTTGKEQEPEEPSKD